MTTEQTNHRNRHNRRIIESLCAKFNFTIHTLKYMPNEHTWHLTAWDAFDYLHEIKAQYLELTTALIAKHKNLTCDIWCGDLFDGVQ